MVISTVEQCIDGWSAIDWSSIQTNAKNSQHSFSESSQQIIQARKALIEKSRGFPFNNNFVEAKANKSEEALLELVKTFQKTVDDLIFKCKEREESFNALVNVISTTPNPNDIIADWQVNKQ